MKSIASLPARFLPYGGTLRERPGMGECRHRAGRRCRTRYFCPSCHQKRVLLYGEWVEEHLLEPVPHRQYVFTLPRLLRALFGRHRAWLGELCRIAARLLLKPYALALPGARPGLILFVQTFGDLANFNPHVHVLATDGAFCPDGSFVALPPVPEAALEQVFQAAVLAFLAKTGAISEGLREKLLGWAHSGFSVHNEVRVDDAEGRRQLARYMLRAPMSLGKMTYDAPTGTVIYRSRMHAGLKRNFQLMPGAEWLELLLRHIPDRYEHLVRYVGWYSNRVRGERAKRGMSEQAAEAPIAPPEPSTEIAARAKVTWARLIRKVYETDPLTCPKCQKPMRVIALINDPNIVRRILEHLGRWAPLPTERAPPDPHWPQGAVIPLTYHPVPDIA